MDNKNENNRGGGSLCNPETRFQDQGKDKDQNNDELHQELIPKRETSTQQTSKKKGIQGWLSGSSRSLRSSEASTEIVHPDECSSYGDNYSVSAPSASTRSSAIVAADENDLDYRDSLSYRNIHIEYGELPIERIQRATEMIERPRETPKMDNAAFQDLIRTIRRIQTQNEYAIKELASTVVPATERILDERHSYVMPNQDARFPFLAIEFKSQANKGTHYVATNQVAGAGAIALNGQLELMRRAYGVTAVDASALRFFSITIDQAYAQINVHWVEGILGQDEPCSFRVERIARHFMDSVEGLRAVACAVENILDYGIDTLLPSVCEALDAYETTMIAARDGI
ncbi:hypothetical protein V499_06036 [Pseudogymnoascus sp. VKM F-103]|nr:hypothetical protein V499_06036 [Pseudogymnoascus sp. VKM F-103]